ncbi:hypothetical protein D3C81_305050 [compost metagenome]
MPHREPRNKGTNLCNPRNNPKTLDPLSTLPREPIVIENLNDLRLTYELHQLDGHKAFRTELYKYGLTRNFIDSGNPRKLAIDISNGFPLENPVGWPHRVVELSGPMTMYSIIEHRNSDKFRLVLIGNGDQTIYMVIMPKLAYSFVIDAVSLDAKDAVLNLYAHQLDKGNGLYNSTMQILEDLFYKLFAAVIFEPRYLEFKIHHIKGDLMNMRLYLFPQEPDKNMLSSNGWVFDVDLSEFPGKQISRGYNLQQKELRKKRERDDSREKWNREAGRPTMSDAERKRMIARMDS